jgi:hypothetical protein
MRSLKEKKRKKRNRHPFPVCSTNSFCLDDLVTSWIKLELLNVAANRAKCAPSISPKRNSLPDAKEISYTSDPAHCSAHTVYLMLVELTWSLAYERHYRLTLHVPDTQAHAFLSAMTE